MPSIVLRVAGADFDVDAFLASHTDLDVDAVWHVGVVTMPGRRAPTSSGFNLCLGDDEDKVVALERMRASLQRVGPAVKTARTMGAGACIDVGLFVGDAFTQTLHLTAADLVHLVSLGVSLEISVYPTNE